MSKEYNLIICRHYGGFFVEVRMVWRLLLDYLPGSIGESFAPFAALCQIYSLFTPPSIINS